MLKGIQIFLVYVTALAVLLQQGHEPISYWFEGGGCSAPTAPGSGGVFADLRSEVSPSPPSTQAPEATEGQELFEDHGVAFGRRAAALSWCIQSLRSLTTCAFCCVFRAWGALLTLKLWMHEGDGALSSLLVPQQYFFFLFSF